MALTKAKKAVQIDKLTHELEGASSAIVGTFAKLTVSQDFELRKVVRALAAAIACSRTSWQPVHRREPRSSRLFRA